MNYNININNLSLTITSIIKGRCKTILEFDFDNLQEMLKTLEEFLKEKIN